jgi:hypothetical protein
MTEEDVFLATPRASDELSALLPPRLSHDVFLQADFDPNAFLLSHRHSPIEDLRSDLKAYLSTLRQDLTGVINSSYEDFLGLGIGLRGTDKRLERIREPIAGFQQEIQVRLRWPDAAGFLWGAAQSITDALIEARKAIEEKLEEREQVRAQKGTLRLLLSVHESVLKVEALLLIPSPEAAGKPQTNGIVSSPVLRGGSQPGQRSVHPFRAELIDSQCRTMGSASQRIERVAVEYSQLLYLVQKAGQAAFITTLEPASRFPEQTSADWSPTAYRHDLQNTHSRPGFSPDFPSPFSGFAFRNETQTRPRCEGGPGIPGRGAPDVPVAFKGQRSRASHPARAGPAIRPAHNTARCTFRSSLAPPSFYPLHREPLADLFSSGRHGAGL